MIIIKDNHDREDEGDLFLPAQYATIATINFMITYARGLICVPLTKKKAELLKLPLMISESANQEYTRCNFAVSIDARNGIRSGISASDRAQTIRVLADPKSQASDLVRPGHIFPLIAKAGGLIERAGHTEAAIELCTLANTKLVGVICEIVGDEGEMLRGGALENYAKKHQLKIITIEQIINYIQNEKK
ncbi:3,4-dihydroxy-2-butanone-4-phosphate synthase [bacterium]|nr:3,4-dihydroxy-2-butanone-4-phosphate synthase [bacterium]